MKGVDGDRIYSHTESTVNLVGRGPIRIAASVQNVRQLETTLSVNRLIKVGKLF